MPLRLPFIAYLCVVYGIATVSTVEDRHVPRLYTMRVDGEGGLELLRAQDVAAYLEAAERDPDAVVLTERLPDCAGVACVTVLRKMAGNPSEVWLRPYAEETVVPPGLRVSTSAGVTPDKVSCSRVVYENLYSPD